MNLNQYLRNYHIELSDILSYIYLFGIVISLNHYRNRINKKDEADDKTEGGKGKKSSKRKSSKRRNNKNRKSSKRKH
tara:strand:- start:217 stop:447 length:231 start_codon:yes stop_codon:yes gene_type:complete